MRHAAPSQRLAGWPSRPTERGEPQAPSSAACGPARLRPMTMAACIVDDQGAEIVQLFPGPSPLLSPSHQLRRRSSLFRSFGPMPRKPVARRSSGAPSRPSPAPTIRPSTPRPPPCIAALKAIAASNRSEPASAVCSWRWSAPRSTARDRADRGLRQPDGNGDARTGGKVDLPGDRTCRGARPAAVAASRSRRSVVEHIHGGQAVGMFNHKSMESEHRSKDV